MGNADSSFHYYDGDAETVAALLDILDGLDDDERLDSPAPEYVPDVQRIAVMAQAEAIVSDAWNLIAESMITNSESWLDSAEGLAQARSKITMLHSSLMAVQGLTRHGYEDLVEVAIDVEPRSGASEVSLLLVSLPGSLPKDRAVVRVSLVLAGRIVASGIVDEFGVASLQMSNLSLASPEDMTFVWEYPKGDRTE